MKTYSNRPNMRAAFAAMTEPSPGGGSGARIMQRGPEGAESPDHGEAPDSSPASRPVMDAWIIEAFVEMAQGWDPEGPFLLLPCSVNGERTAAIVHISHVDRHNRTHVTPLFVAMTPGMVLIDHNGRRAGST
jgi:hypothetical protein